MQAYFNPEIWQQLLIGLHLILIWLPAYLSGFCVLAIYVLKDHTYFIGAAILLWFISLLFSGVQVLPFLVTTVFLIVAGLLVEKQLSRKS